MSELWIRTPAHSKGGNIARMLLVFCSTCYIITFVAIAMIRDFLLVEYEWLEGFHLAQVHWLLAGNPLYTEPSLEYVPILYGPLYAYVSSAFVFILGEYYGTLRLVSLLATLGTQILLGWMVWRKTRSLLGAFVAAGLYAGMYGATGFYYDMARVDAVYIFLTTAAACAIWIAAEKGGAATFIAAVTATGAVLTKQTALLPVIALCLWSLARHTRRGRLTALLCLGAIVVSQLVPALTGNSWFFYYLYKVPSSHPLSLENFYDFLFEIGRYLSIGLALTGFGLYRLFQKPGEKQDAWFFLVSTSAMFFAGFLPRLKTGGAVNDLMPIATAIALCCGVTAGLVRHYSNRAALVVFSLLLCFNAQLLYQPRKALFSSEIELGTQAAINVFRRLEGPVFAPCHPYFPLLAGKNGSAFWMPIYDLSQTQDAAWEILQAKLCNALREKRFRTIVFPRTFSGQTAFPYLLENYRPANSDGVNGIQEAIGNLSIYVPRE